MPDFHQIYRDHADAYDRLVRAEDVDGNLSAAIRELVAPAGRRVVEVGAGTGRVTQLLYELGAARVLATEPYAGMRELARARFTASAAGDDDASRTVRVVDGCATALPAPDADADLAVAGWVLGHFRGWHPDTWRVRIDAAIAEMRRVVNDAGQLLIIETMGTGASEPAPPSEALAAYYAHLEDTHGFARTVVATDYAFESVDDAADTLGFFFGDAFERRIRAERWTRVPEWTGLWVSGPAGGARR